MNILLNDGRLEKVQSRNAALVIGIPFLASLVGIYQLVTGQYRALDIISLAAMYIVSIIGIDVGFHRYFSHKSFKAAKSVEIVLGVLASLAAQGPLMYWVANHRRHHALTDQKDDAHSPYFSEYSTLNPFAGFIRSQVY